jgi:hypothetical protein
MKRQMPSRVQQTGLASKVEGMVDETLRELRGFGFTSTLTTQTHLNIIRYGGLNRATFAAMAGIIEPVTIEFDVHLNVIRGQVSETFVWNVAEEWKVIDKPIYAYYLGDHDPAGFKIFAPSGIRLAMPLPCPRPAVLVSDFGLSLSFCSPELTEKVTNRGQTNIDTTKSAPTRARDVERNGSQSRLRHNSRR